MTSFLKKLDKAISEVFADAVKLQNKALDASIVAFIVAVSSPFGLDLGPYGGKILGILAAVGAIAALGEKVIAKL